MNRNPFENEMCPIDQQPTSIEWSAFLLSCCMLVLIYVAMGKLLLRLSRPLYEEPLFQEMRTLIQNISKDKVKDQFLQANILANKFKMEVYHQLLGQ
jgi:hypothetical protein